MNKLSISPKSQITQLLNGETNIKLGALHPTRDLVFVKDTVSGFCEISKADHTIGEEINIATQDEISILDLAETLIAKINPEAQIISDELRQRPDKSEVERLLGANDKIKAMTNWRPKYTLETGLQETINWFSDKHNLSQYKSDIYNV